MTTQQTHYLDSLEAWLEDNVQCGENAYGIHFDSDRDFSSQALEGLDALKAEHKELLAALRCALADLQGIMPEFEPSGDEHPEWKTIEEWRSASAYRQIQSAVQRAEAAIAKASK